MVIEQQISNAPWARILRTRVGSWLFVQDSVRRHMLLLCAVFALGRIAAVLDRQPLRYPDSAGYLKIDLFGHSERLWTVPLLLRPLPSDDARLVAQTAIAVFCWSALAFAVARVVKHALVARLAPVLVLILGSCVQVTEWDVTILSESIAISLTALLVALALRTYMRPSRWTLIAILVVLTLWTFTRQLQAGVVVPLALVAAVVLLIRRSRRQVLVAVLLVALACWSAYDNSQSHAVTAGTAHDLLVFRIFPTKGGPAFFASRGMPYVNQFKREAEIGVYLGARSPTRNDPRWLAWVRKDWLASYAAWLSSRPGTEIGDAVGRSRVLLSGYPVYAHPRPVLPGFLQDAMWSKTSGPRVGELQIWATIVVLLILFSAALTRRVPVHPVAGVAVGASALWYFVGYLFGQLELARISVPPGASLRIGLILLGAGALDTALRWRAVRAESASPSTYAGNQKTGVSRQVPQT